MRLTIYKTELSDNLHTKLVKEKAYNCNIENLNNPSIIVNIMNNIFHMNKMSEEYLYMIALNTKYKPLGIFEISHGTANCSLSNPREIFNRLLLCGANAFVLMHNHPSGDITPSQEDIKVYRRIKECSELMGIDFLDNLIIGNDYYSFREHE